MNVAVLVPRRADGGRRDTLWRWVADRWATERPDWPVIEGHHDEGPFNRSAAINAAAAQWDWDVAVIADSDTFAGLDQIEAAIAKAKATNQITFAFDRFCYLSRAMSDRIMDGYQGMWEPGVEWTMTATCSSMVIVTRPLWDEVGGFDEGFVGWGMEDVGFRLACQALAGGMQRIPGPVWHLHHTPSPENAQTPEYLANVERMRLYEACDYDPARMRALLAELR